MPECVPYITCIAQVTLKFVNYTLLVYNRRFFLLHFKFLFDLENDVMTTPKRRSILPALIFTCFCITKPLLIRVFNQTLCNIIEHHSTYSRIIKIYQQGAFKMIPSKKKEYLKFSKTCSN